VNCPVDCTELRITDRQGIEIDYCPQCRGIWLDRGELDKMLERSAQMPYPEPRDRYDEPSRPPRDRDYDRDHDRGYGRKSKRRSFLEDLLDFD
jgi:Zn-finger nucleic acid-binding protein